MLKLKDHCQIVLWKIPDYCQTTIYYLGAWEVLLRDSYIPLPSESFPVCILCYGLLCHIHQYNPHKGINTFTSLHRFYRTQSRLCWVSPVCAHVFLFYHICRVPRGKMVKVCGQYSSILKQNNSHF